jgi:hypothetical protein
VYLRTFGNVALIRLPFVVFTRGILGICWKRVGIHLFQ